MSGAAEGVMHYSRSTSGRQCICCDGPHIFGRGLEVVGSEAFMEPGTQGLYPADMKDWLWRQYRGVPDGARVRVTFEVLDG